MYFPGLFYDPEEVTPVGTCQGGNVPLGHIFKHLISQAHISDKASIGIVGLSSGSQVNLVVVSLR